MIVFIVIAVTTFALLFGAFWGLKLGMPGWLEGFLVALAGGALIEAVMGELIEPAALDLPLWLAMLWVLIGAVIFTFLDRWVDKRFASSGGLGLALAITLDGVPENLALGTALIGAGPMEVMALAGSIFLSNLPEAAGGAKEMEEDGWSHGKALALWGGVAALLAASAMAGNFLLNGAAVTTLAGIKCFAAGAIVASLATEVFPTAFKKDHFWTGIAVASGLVIAFSLGQLGG